METTLYNAQAGQEYIIRRIDTNDAEMNAFLFSLGCYTGESVTLISRKGKGRVIAVKDARYSIDAELANAIIV